MKINKIFKGNEVRMVKSVGAFAGVVNNQFVKEPIFKSENRNVSQLRIVLLALLCFSLPCLLFLVNSKGGLMELVAGNKSTTRENCLERKRKIFYFC